MRAFIVKYTFGRYWWKLPFQTHFNVTSRGPFWYYNGFLFIGLLWMITGRPEWLIFYPSLIWMAVVVYFGFSVGGFGYYTHFPVQWDELDDEQKWYYGLGATSAQLSKKVPFTDAQFEEWVDIRQRMWKKYNLK